MLGESTDHGTACERLASFEVVNRPTKNSIGACALDLVLRAVVVGMDFRHHGQADLVRELTPLGDFAHVTREDDHVRRRGTDRLVLDGGNPPDINQREVEAAFLHALGDAPNEILGEFRLVVGLEPRCQVGVGVHSLLEPRPFSVWARRDHIRIRRAGDCAHDLLEAFAQTTFARPRRAGKHNLFHEIASTFPRHWPANCQESRYATPPSGTKLSSTAREEE